MKVLIVDSLGVFARLSRMDCRIDEAIMCPCTCAEPVVGIHLDTLAAACAQDQHVAAFSKPCAESAWALHAAGLSLRRQTRAGIPATPCQRPKQSVSFLSAVAQGKQAESFVQSQLIKRGLETKMQVRVHSTYSSRSDIRIVDIIDSSGIYREIKTGTVSYTRKTIDQIMKDAALQTNAPNCNGLLLGVFSRQRWKGPDQQKGSGRIGQTGD